MMMMTNPIIHLVDNNTTVLCQGFASLMNHMPNDASRAATSKLFVMANNKQQPWTVSSTAHHKIKAGAELTVDYADGILRTTTTTSTRNFRIPNVPPARTPEWLRAHGVCLDHMRLGRDSGTAVAARRMTAGDLVIVSPVVRLPHATTGVLRRYCIVTAAGEIYFPYGPGVGYLSRRHDRQANVALRWDGALLQVYATRDIGADEVLSLGSHYDKNGAEEDGPLVMAASVPPYPKTL